MSEVMQWLGSDVMALSGWGFVAWGVVALVTMGVIIHAMGEESRITRAALEARFDERKRMKKAHDEHLAEKEIHQRELQRMYDNLLARHTALVVDADVLGMHVNQLREQQPDPHALWESDVRDAQAVNDLHDGKEFPLHLLCTAGGACEDDQVWVADRAGNVGVVMDRDDWMELHCVMSKLNTNSPLTIEEQSHIANLHGDLLRDLRRGIEKAVNKVRVKAGASKIDFDDIPEWEFPYGGWDN